MTVQDTARTVTVPRQAGPADRPVEAPAPVVAAAPAPTTALLLGRERPLTADERQFALGLVMMVLALAAVIVGGLLLAQHLWT